MANILESDGDGDSFDAGDLPIQTPAPAPKTEPSAKKVVNCFFFYYN